MSGDFSTRSRRNDNVPNDVVSRPRLRTGGCYPRARATSKIRSTVRSATSYAVEPMEIRSRHKASLLQRRSSQHVGECRSSITGPDDKRNGQIQHRERASIPMGQRQQSNVCAALPGGKKRLTMRKKSRIAVLESNDQIALPGGSSRPAHGRRRAPTEHHWVIPSVQ